MMEGIQSRLVIGVNYLICCMQMEDLGSDLARIATDDDWSIDTCPLTLMSQPYSGYSSPNPGGPPKFNPDTRPLPGRISISLEPEILSDSQCRGLDNTI
jgi:hypothetical protein